MAVYILGCVIVTYLHIMVNLMSSVCRMETIDIKGITYRYYVADRKMDHDEDDTVEFKGHLNFTKEQVPPYALDPMYNRPSRQPISK